MRIISLIWLDREMKENMEFDDILGINKGEILTKRKFQPKCNKTLPNAKKIELFCGETWDLGAFHFYKRGDMFKKIKIKKRKKKITDIIKEIDNMIKKTHKSKKLIAESSWDTSQEEESTSRQNKQVHHKSGYQNENLGHDNLLSNNLNEKKSVQETPTVKLNVILPDIIKSFNEDAHIDEIPQKVIVSALFPRWNLRPLKENLCRLLTSQKY